MNHRKDGVCTIDQWDCNGLIPCHKCSVALDYLTNFWKGWAEEHNYDPNTLEFVPNADGFDVFVEGE
jgi:hypothetical protein